MASKNTNIVSKTLVESYIRKQVKALKQSPAETIDTLTKQLLDKPKGSLPEIWQCRMKTDSISL